MTQINQTILAELIFQHVDDSVTWCRLAQVSKRFNAVSKNKLVAKERQLTEVFHTADSYFNESNSTVFWTELPTNGKSHGISRCIDENGKMVSEEYYLNGYQHKYYKKWHANGQLHIESNIHQNKLNGQCRLWYPNGQIHLESYYVLEKLHGLSRKWGLNGKPEYVRNYDHGSITPFNSVIENSND